MLYVIDIEQSKITESFNLPNNKKSQIAFNSNSDFLANVYKNKITIIDLKTKNTFELVSSEYNHINTMSISHNSQFLAVADSSDNKSSICIWDLKKKERSLEIEFKDDIVYSLAFSPNDSLLAIGTLHDGLVSIRDINSKSELATIKAHEGAIFRVHFENNHTLWTESLDNYIKKWDLSILNELDDIDKLIEKSQVKYNLKLDGINVVPMN